MTTRATAALLLLAGCAPDAPPTRPEAERAQILVERGRPEEAVASLSAAIRAEPDNAELLVRRALAHEAAGDATAAAADYSAALQLDPRNAQALTNRATISARGGDLDAAIRDLTAALSVEPGDALAYGNRAQAYIDSGRGPEAEADLTMAERVDPGSPLTALRLGDARLLQADRAGAADALREAAGRASGDAGMLVRVMRSMAAAGLFEPAGDAALAALDAEPLLAGRADVEAVLRTAAAAAAVREAGMRAEPSDAADLTASGPNGARPVFVAQPADGGWTLSAAQLAAAKRSDAWLVAVPADGGSVLVTGGDLDLDSLVPAAFRRTAPAVAPPPEAAE